MAVILTKQQAIYRYLRSRILDGRFEPGRRLVIDNIAAELGVSLIPVREALHRLEAERLIRIRPHAGATVASLTPKDIEETFMLLEGLETVTIQKIAGRCSARRLSELERLVREMDLAQRGNSLGTWSALNMRFHLAMARETRLPWLIEMMDRVFGRWDRICRHFFSGTNHRFAEAQEEHHLLVRALGAGDGRAAERIIRRHNRRALEYYSGPRAKPKSKTGPKQDRHTIS